MITGTTPVRALSPRTLQRARALSLVLSVLFIVSPVLGTTPTASYPRIEASLTLASLASDPFDFTQTDVRVEIAQPDGTVLSLPAFYDGGSTWRVRHTPMLAGEYRVGRITLNGQAAANASAPQPNSWNVTGLPTGAGFVRVDASHPSKFVTDNGHRYFPTGHNAAWDTDSRTNIVSIMPRMGAAHENWSRVWMDHWDGKNLDWPKTGNFGTLSLTVARKWDAIVTAAEQSGIAFQMTLHHHGQYSSQVDPNWGQNPYNSANGGFLANAGQFFTDATAKALTKRKLRYAVARWGYSTSIMAWELFNEVQFTDAALNGQWNVVGAWHDEMAQFLRSQDSYRHLITTSSELGQPIWGKTDYYQHHDYPGDVVSGLRDAPSAPSGQAERPIFGGECGLATTPGIGVPAALWPGLMAAQSGTSQPWWWDRIDAEGDYGYFRAFSDFITEAGIGDQDGLAKSTPVTTSEENGALSFTPGGGWATASQDVFTVGPGAPDGIGTLPSFLQGTYHRSMTPNGYTFKVNFQSPGTFAVQIVEIAASGAGLTVSVDGITAKTASFPAPGSDETTNLTLTVNLAAGAHAVKLINPGLDWIVLGAITLDPYVPILGAYEIGNTNFVAAWIWHRLNLLDPNAMGSSTGTVTLAGLEGGTYAGRWWDTTTGQPLTNVSFSVPSGGATVTLPIPPILRSVAFYAGVPAQAAVDKVAISQVLGTNSPPLQVPITISNHGGLPLSYALASVGASSSTNWLRLPFASGRVAKGSDEAVTIVLAPGGLTNGTYQATLRITTSDPVNPEFDIPLTMDVSPIAAWRQSHFGRSDNGGEAADTADPDNDGLINILEYAFNTSPLVPDQNPVSWKITEGSLVLTFKRPHPAPGDISYLIDTTDNLVSGPWRSGASVLAQTILDNGDGTETVTIRDLVSTNLAAEHYIRLRIGRP